MLLMQLQDRKAVPTRKPLRMRRCGYTRYICQRITRATRNNYGLHVTGRVTRIHPLRILKLSGAQKTTIGTKTSSVARARTKAERASVTEVLEGKAAVAFSKSTRSTDEKPPKPRKEKKDRPLDRFQYICSTILSSVLQEVSMEEKRKKDFQKDHAARLG